MLWELFTTNLVLTKKIILIANYRYPVGKYVLQFPGGQTDNEDDCVGDAIRELKEETGYTASRIVEVKSVRTCPLVSPILYIDPWKSNENCQLVVLEVDGDDLQNQFTKQSLEDDEMIQVHLLDLTKNAVKDLEDLAQKNNFLIESRAYMFLWGISFAKNHDL